MRMSTDSNVKGELSSADGLSGRGPELLYPFEEFEEEFKEGFKWGFRVFLRGLRMFGHGKRFTDGELDEFLGI